MTLSKPVKKKKKTKSDKSKDDGKKAEPTRPPTPIDKGKMAEENLREMIKAAHQMHKNYTRSLNGLSAHISRDTIWKFKDPKNPRPKKSDEGRYITFEMSKRNSKTTGGVMEESMSSIHVKTSRRLSEEGPSRRASIQLGRKIDAVSGRRGSAIETREEGPPRASSAAVPTRRAKLAQRQGSAEFPATKTEGHMGAAGRSGKSRDNLLRIKDYKIGSFVSLELLDKMKCHESDMSVRPRKSILRRNRKPASDVPGKKSKKEEERKTDEIVSERKSSSPKVEEEKKSQFKKRPATKRGRPESELTPVMRETRGMNRMKPVIPKSASSNPDSITSSVTGVGDFFSSNSSYFSSESDISKIDKKFMQILEAVTQTKIGFEERVKQMAAERVNDGNLPSTSKKAEEEMKTREQSEVEQQLLDRISCLEEKLREKQSMEDNTQKQAQLEETKKGDVMTKTGGEQVRDKSDSLQLVAGEKPKNVDKNSKEGLNIREPAPIPKLFRKRQDPVAEVKPAKTSVDVKGQEGEVRLRPQTETKKRRRDQGKEIEKEVTEKVGDSSPGDAKNEKEYKRVGTWSIIKRLEKAFQTLGLNMEDMDNSEEEEEKISAKKKQRVKFESSGQEKEVLPQSETLRRCQETVRASASGCQAKSGHASGDTPFAVETNGSGDKSTEYKRTKNLTMEDLVKVSKEMKPKDKYQKEAYYASVRVMPRIKGSLNGLPDGKLFETVTRKKYGDTEKLQTKQTAEHITTSKKSKEELTSSKRYKRPYLPHFDDGCLGHGKSKSDYFLSVSCSASSFSEEEGKKCRKRKKIHSVFKEPNPRDDEAWTNKNGKGDAMSQTFMIREKTDREVQPDRILSCENVKNAKNTSGMQTPTKSHKILKMEEENDELELKQIRQRHKKLISEIKLSLEEIKKQHNLWSKLRRQTRQFNRDCHAKRRMLAMYLKDVESSYERRMGGYPSWDVASRYSTPLSSDSNHQFNIQKKKILGKHSDWDLQTRQKYGRDEMMEDFRDTDEITFSVFETDNESSTVSDFQSSRLPTRTSTELALTDTAEESCISNKSVPDKEITSVEIQVEGNITQLPSEDGTKQNPSYITQLLHKLNTMIVKEKSQLENLVLKASDSSNRSMQTNKAKQSLSAKSSSSSLHREQHKTNGITRTAATVDEISSGNFCGNMTPRQRKSKRNVRDKSPDIDDGKAKSSSTSFISGDPGGPNLESPIDQKQEVGIWETSIQATDISQTGASCIHLKKHVEEHRYRKGDPSFRSQNPLFQQQHSTHCMEKIPEDDDAWKRKLEIERILRVSENMFKKSASFSKDSVFDHDSYITAKGRQVSHGRHRPQSIIIDHNRGEENEESQIVLGHASRHSGVSFGLWKYDRQYPHDYLKAGRNSESCYTGRILDKKGKKNHLDKYPTNHSELNVSISGSSTTRCREVSCQTDNLDDYEDVCEMYLLEESVSNPSLN